MRQFIIILFLFISGNLIAQHGDKESFVNEVYKLVIKSNIPYFKLSKEAHPIHNDIFNEFSGLKGVLPDTITSQILNNNSFDTIKQFWDCQKLTQADCVEEDSIGIITGTDIRTNSLQSQKQLHRYYRHRSKMPWYDKTVYFFSKPIYDDRKEYAVISMSYTCGRLCGYGCMYVFKKNNNDWTLIAKLNCWIS